MTMLVEDLVHALTTQLVSTIRDEAQFCINFKSELEQMEEWLNKMNDLLEDVDKKLAWDQKSIKVSLIDLRGVIYEADNAVTDCLIREVEKPKKWFCSCLLPLDPVFQYKMGWRLTKINSEMKDVHDKLASYVRVALAVSNPSDSMSQKINSSCTHSVASRDFCTHETYGLQNDIKKLKGWILDNKKEPVAMMNYIGIVGMGGLGKTTLAQELKEKISCHFEKTIWVCVSGNFNDQLLAEKMLKNVRDGKTPSEEKTPSEGKTPSEEKTPSEGKTPSDSDMLKKLIEELKGKSYLIVLDNVWPYQKNPYWLRDLCSSLPTSVDKSNWIIITTRNEDVVKNMFRGNTQIHYPKPLNNKDSWVLFSEHAFPKSKRNCPNAESRKHDSEHILKKCGGLPLAIKTLGSLSQKVDSPSGWKDISEKFHLQTTDGKTEPVYSSLRLSYDELPSASLKQCILCVSIYPEGFEINAEQLIHFWVGEGLVRKKESKTAIELGYENLAELVNRCLIEVVDRRWYDGKVNKCKIHDMVREVILRIAGEEAFCILNERGNLMQKHGQNKQKPRWFRISEDMDDGKNELENNPKLRTFFLMSSPPNNFGKNFGFLESLRVLDLSYSKVVEDSSTPSPVTCGEDLFRYISSLKRLACLNLSGTQIREVPSSIQKLLNLQLLVLNGCKKLAKIHPSIKCLKRLIVLDVGDCPLDCLPKGLGSLSLLEELTGFKVVNTAKTLGCALRELRKLKDQLRVLQIVLSADAEISPDEIGILSSLTNLKVLTIDAEECKEMETLKNLGMPPQLRSLYLRNYHSGKIMPDWFHPDVLSSLQYLFVEKCDIERLTSDESTWKKVEGLCLKSLEYEEDWVNLKKIMPELRCMEISSCLKFKNFPCPVNNQGVWKNPN